MLVQKVNTQLITAFLYFLCFYVLMLFSQRLPARRVGGIRLWRTYFYDAKRHQKLRHPIHFPTQTGKHPATTQVSTVYPSRHGRIAFGRRFSLGCPARLAARHPLGLRPACLARERAQK